jgi:hypothetical protein
MGSDADTQLPIFWRKLLLPSLSSSLKMEVAGTSKMLVTVAHYMALHPRRHYH